MKSFTYTIRDKEGIHARPAGIVVAAAKKFTSDIKISSKGKVTDLKRIFGVMGLCVKCGEEVTITVEGGDESEACASLEKVFAANL